MLLFSFQMFAHVVDALDEAAKDPDTIITAITGAGNVFCAGNDRSNFRNCTMKHCEELLMRFDQIIFIQYL